MQRYTHHHPPNPGDGAQAWFLASGCPPVTAILLKELSGSFEVYANLNERDCWITEDKADLTSSRAVESISLVEDVLALEEVQDLEAQMRDKATNDARRLTGELPLSETYHSSV
jgi:hypothetical protein